MGHPACALLELVLLVLAAGGTMRDAGAQAAPTLVATPAPAHVVVELRGAVERARQQFEARDQAGILAAVSEQYRSGGITKAGLRDQLQAVFALYPQLRARVAVDRVDLVSGGTWVYTTGEVTGRLPVVGWVTVLAWQGEPEVARRETSGWRLYGFQN
jgi:hypothetical protein